MHQGCLLPPSHLGAMTVHRPPLAAVNQILLGFATKQSTLYNFSCFIYGHQGCHYHGDIWVHEYYPLHASF